MSVLRNLTSARELNCEKINVSGADMGVVPVVCIDSEAMGVDGLRSYRMQGFANEEAVDLTLKTGFATFYSRTRNGLWVKGEESGNLLIVRAAYTDCDSDSVLLDVSPQGPTCHTGLNSCFETKDIGE